MQAERERLGSLDRSSVKVNLASIAGQLFVYIVLVKCQSEEVEEELSLKYVARTVLTLLTLALELAMNTGRLM